MYMKLQHATISANHMAHQMVATNVSRITNTIDISFHRTNTLECAIFLAIKRNQISHLSSKVVVIISIIEHSNTGLFITTKSFYLNSVYKASLNGPSCSLLLPDSAIHNFWKIQACFSMQIMFTFLVHCNYI